MTTRSDTASYTETISIDITMMAYLPSVLITGRRLLKRARASVTFLGEHPSMGATITVAPRLNDSVTIGIKCSKAGVSLRLTRLKHSSPYRIGRQLAKILVAVTTDNQK